MLKRPVSAIRSDGERVQMFEVSRTRGEPELQTAEGERLSHACDRMYIDAAGTAFVVLDAYCYSNRQ